VRRGIAFGSILLAACAAPGDETVPVRGPLPRTVAVWPSLGEAFAASRDVLLAGLDAALFPRGYAVIPPAVAAELLAGAAIDATAADPAASGRALAADAVLQFVVRDFVVEGERPLRAASWDVEWRLVSTRGAGVLWNFAHRGSWHRATDDGRDPHRALDAEAEITPIGGRGPANHRDAIDLCAALHRLAMAKLPRRSS